MRLPLIPLSVLLLSELLVAQGASPSGMQLPVSSERWAVVVGVNRYDDTQINPNKGAVNDAKAIAEVLVQYSGFPKDHVILLISDSTSNITQDRGIPVLQPKKSEILRQLVALRKSTPTEGLIVFAFSGHGIQVDDDAYLLPMDAHYAEGAVDLLEDTSIKMSTLREYLSNTNLTQVIALFDACRNTPVMPGRSAVQQPMGEPYKLKLDLGNHGIRAFAVLYASEKGYKSFENPNTQQGYFSQAFVEGLKGRAADEKIVTLSSLLNYLQTIVPQRVWDDFKAVQKPYAVVEGYRADKLALSESPQWLNPLDLQPYVLIPKGTAKLGCIGANHPSCTPKEQPQPDISIPQFRMGQTEVTVAAYRRFVEMSGSGLGLPPDPKAFNEAWKDPAQPIVRVTWNEAQRYCRWIGGRLPTEAEWEYAASGGTLGLEYPGGNTISHDDANYGKDKCCEGVIAAGTRDQWVYAAPVAKFRKNGFDLFDMPGNVAEWVETPYLLPAEADHIAKGGSWRTPAAFLRVSSRVPYRPNGFADDVGFRCVLPLH